MGTTAALRRRAKAARAIILAGLSAISLLLAGAPAFAANGCEPREGAPNLGSAERCSGPALRPDAGGKIANDSAAAVADPLVVSIPHHLGRREALRRLKAGLAEIKKNYGFLFAMQDETWTGYQLRFRASVIGLPVTGTIDVLDHRVDLQAFFPWLLAPFAEAAVPAIRQEGIRILEGKYK